MIEIDKTIFDVLPKKKPLVESPPVVHPIETMEELMCLVEKHLKENSVQEPLTIRISYKSTINIGVLWAHGFGSVHGANPYTLKFFGYKMWVYYKGGRAIYFSRDGVLCANPVAPHITNPESWWSDTFKHVVKEFDHVELHQF